MGGRPQWEVTHLRRAVTGNNVPLPRTLMRLVLALVVPRLVTRLLLTMLPPELGTYLIAADQTLYLAGGPHNAPPMACAGSPRAQHSCVSFAGGLGRGRAGGGGVDQPQCLIGVGSTMALRQGVFEKAAAALALWHLTYIPHFVLKPDT